MKKVKRVSGNIKALFTVFRWSFETIKISTEDEFLRTHDKGQREDFLKWLCVFEIHIEYPFV